MAALHQLVGRGEAADPAADHDGAHLAGPPCALDRARLVGGRLGDRGRRPQHAAQRDLTLPEQHQPEHDDGNQQQRVEGDRVRGAECDPRAEDDDDLAREVLEGPDPPDVLGTAITRFAAPQTPR